MNYSSIPIGSCLSIQEEFDAYTINDLIYKISNYKEQMHQYLKNIENLYIHNISIESGKATILNEIYAELYNQINLKLKKFSILK